MQTNSVFVCQLYLGPRLSCCYLDNVLNRSSIRTFLKNEKQQVEMSGSDRRIPVVSPHAFRRRYHRYNLQVQHGSYLRRRKLPVFTLINQWMVTFCAPGLCCGDKTNHLITDACFSRQKLFTVFTVQKTR